MDNWWEININLTICLADVLRRWFTELSVRFLLRNISNSDDCWCSETDRQTDRQTGSNTHKFHLIHFLCSIRICWLHDTNYQGLALISKRTTERQVKWTQSYKHFVIGRWKPSGPMCLLSWHKLIIPLRFCSFLAANLSTDFYQVSSAVQWSDLPIRGPDW